MVITPLVFLGFLVVLVVLFGLLRGFASCLLKTAAVLITIFLVIFFIQTVLAM